MLNNLALLYDDQGRYAKALKWKRRGTAIHRKRFTVQDVQESKGLLSEQRGVKRDFLFHIDLALHLEKAGGRGDLMGEAFQVLQLARTSAAGGAIARMAARFAAGSDQVASMVRQQQDALGQYQSLDQKLIKAVSAAPETRNNELEKNLRKQIGSLKAKLTGLDKDIATQFPEYATLMSREPMPGAEVQQLLGKDEALLTFIRSWKGDKTHVFVVRSDGLRAYTVPVSLEKIKDAVAELRAGLDLSDVQSLSDLASFDTTLAFELYEKLFKPAEEMLQGVRHLFVVPTGPLQSLPPGCSGDETARDIGLR